MKKQSETLDATSSPGSDDLTIVVHVRIRPTEQQIQQRTCELHLARGGKSHPLLDWLQAERELNAMLNSLQEYNPAMPGTSLPPQNQLLRCDSCRQQCPTPCEGSHHAIRHKAN